MIRRIIATVMSLICLCSTSWANQEISVALNRKDNVFRENIAFAYLTFEFKYSIGNNAKVNVIVENTTQDPPLAILMFRRPQEEKYLKKETPKIEFDKKYPGEKGQRSVSGFKADYKNLDIVTAAESDTLFSIDVPFTSDKEFTLPLYVAKYNPKQLFKKGKDKISYKILEEHIYNIKIKVVGWSEGDPEYVGIKKNVKKLIDDLSSTKFCRNSRHNPSLKNQQRPYLQTRDSLVRVINSVLEANYHWMSTDDSHKAYSRLLSELNGMDLSRNVYDCGAHKKKSKGHSCAYCNLNARDIYHRLDDLYQQLHAGKIQKAYAMKTAKALYGCYTQNKKRSKDSSYDAKISRFYNSIVNY